MSAERRILVTDQGLVVQVTSLGERLISKVAISRFGRAFGVGMATVLFAPPKEEILQFYRRVDDERTALKIEDDFRKGKIKGVITSADDPRVPRLTFEEKHRKLEEYRLQRV